MKHDTRYQDRSLAAAAYAGSALLVGFWALYFAGAIVMGAPGSVAVQYEAAFPLADAIAAILLGVAGAGLWRGHRSGRFAMTAGAAMVLYLGLLDLTFYSRHGLLSGGGDAALEFGLIAACLGGGAAGLVRCWRYGRTS